jgi:hypothetical protein
LVVTSCAPNPFPKDGSIPADMVVHLSRGVCYGTCPIYGLTVKADGTVNFDGKEYTKTIGQADGHIDEGKLKALIQEFKAADYFDLDDDYTSGDCATDHPTVSTALTINGVSKEIKHDTGCEAPEGLVTLEQRIDELVGSEKWVG